MHEVVEVQIESEGVWLRKSKVKNVSPIGEQLRRLKRE